MKIREHHKRDFRTYARFHKRRFLFQDGKIPFERQGKTALECFVSVESKGVLLPCRHPRLLEMVISGKKQLNWHIEQWGEGIKEGVFALQEFRESFPWLPEWVWQAVLKQAGGVEYDFSWYATLESEG